MALPTVPAAVLDWSAQSVGPGAAVSAVHELRVGRPPWLLFVEFGGDSVSVVLKAGDRQDIRTEVAALRVAAEHGLVTPRVLAADIDGASAGAPAVLMTFLDGDAQIPAAVDHARLRASGMAAADIHRIRLAPTADLPIRERHMPWIDFAEERRLGRLESTPLLDRGDAVIRDVPRGPAAPVFLHGDLWAGNMMWLDGRFVGTIDWEAAGAGAPGVDLGSLRLDAALMHGEGAADEVSAGWAEAAGHPPESVPFWDIVAALNSSADMIDLVPTLPEAGRADLDGPTLTARRDSFLLNAIEAHERSMA